MGPFCADGVGVPALAPVSVAVHAGRPAVGPIAAPRPHGDKASLLPPRLPRVLGTGAGRPREVPGTPRPRHAARPTRTQEGPPPGVLGRVLAVDGRPGGVVLVTRPAPIQVAVRPSPALAADAVP